MCQIPAHVKKVARKTAVREIMARICAFREASRRKYVKANARTAKSDHCRVRKIILATLQDGKISQNYKLFLIAAILRPPQNLH